MSDLDDDLGERTQDHVVPEPDAARPRTNRLAIVAVVVAGLSLVLLFPLGAIAGIALGIIALNQIKRRGDRGSRTALAAVVVGALALPVALTAIVLRNNA